MISPVAIGVAAGLGSLILAFCLVRLYLWARKKTSSKPLPPVQMLAHQRLRQQELYLSQANYADHLQALSPTVDAPSPYGYDSGSSRAQTPDSRLNFDQHPAPSSHASCTSSRVELVASETQLDRPCPAAAAATSSNPFRSSPSTLSSQRGPPHKRVNRFDLVLPTPLATEQNSGRLTQRVSVYDQWTPALSRSASDARIDVVPNPSLNRLSGESVPPVPQVPSTTALNTPPGVRTE